MRVTRPQLEQVRGLLGLLELAELDDNMRLELVGRGGTGELILTVRDRWHVEQHLIDRAGVITRPSRGVFHAG